MTNLDEQLDLFKSYVEQNDIWKANILIKNLFNKHTANEAVFTTFYDFSMKIASWNVDIPNRKMFLEQASTALVFYSEHANLTAEKLDQIHKSQKAIDEVSEQIREVEQLQSNKQLEEIKQQQTEYLQQLTKYKYEIEQSIVQATFQELLEKVKQIEEQIQVHMMDEREQKLYEELTQGYSDVIANKLTEFEQKEATLYNGKAVKDFRDAFESFKEKEEYYKTNIFALKRLVKRKLFMYDMNQLMNETLIYYNHIYAYIFGKLDDAGKYELTALAIETESEK